MDSTRWKKQTYVFIVDMLDRDNKKEFWWFEAYAETTDATQI